MHSIRKLKIQVIPMSHFQSLFRKVYCKRKKTMLKDLLRKLLGSRSEEHTSELQSRGHLVCRLLLEKTRPRTHRAEATAVGGRRGGPRRGRTRRAGGGRRRRPARRARGGAPQRRGTARRTAARRRSG